LLVGQVGFDFQRADISERDAGVLGLAACESSGQVRCER
jgi:hypothetical protein